LNNFIIFNVLNDKFNINANRFKVIFGSGIVLVATLILSVIIAVVVDKLIAKNLNRLIKWSKVGLEKLADINSYKHYLVWIAAGVVITFISESLLREGMEYALDFVHFVEHKKFIANFLLVLVVTSPCLLFNRAYLVLAIICEVLLGLSVASSIMFGFRGTPLTYSDFFAVQDGLAIAGEYVTMSMIVMAGLFIAIFVFINYKLSAIKVRKKFRISKISILVILFVFIYAKANLNYVLNKGILEPVTWDIKYSYNQNGFFFSLYDSYLGYKREKPKSYSEMNVAAIKESFNDELSKSQVSEENPNIILVQLESVMDPYTIDGIELSGDPIKNIREISDKSSSGILQMPSFGGGTARSEFEVMTGMSLDYFSPGELPHNSYLKKDSIESLAYVLDSTIYEKTLIHNYQGSFYERNKAYENLGFERYIPMEYMYDRKFTGEYPEDELILNNIIETMETTDKRDLVFAIGVQTHGGYDTEYTNEDSEVIVSGSLSQEHINQIQDYVDDLVMVDKIVAQLAQFVDNLDEPTILAVYSDHLPSLGPVGEQFTSDDRYSTLYFIHDNTGTEVVDMDIEAYELSTRILDIAKLPGGVMNKFHRQNKNSEYYQEKLEYLQYDILHGKKYIYDKKEPYKRTSMTMGIKEIIIDDINITDNTLEVFGQGFNEYSCIYVDGKPVSTEYVSSNKLVAEISNNKINKIKVHQLTRRNKSIGSTSEYIVQK